MHRALTPRQWPRVRQNHGSYHRCALPSVCLSPSYPLVAKFSSATLGIVSTGVEPARTSLSSRLTSVPAIGFTRAYRLGAKKPSKPSESKKAQAGAGASDTSYPTQPAAHFIQQTDAVAPLDRAKQQLYDSTGVPSERAVLIALLVCDKAARLATGSSTSQHTRNAVESDTAATSLLSMDESTPDPPQPLATQVSNPASLTHSVDHISQVAFDMVNHPTVDITQQVLEAYIVIQARLGRADTLPHVLSLYASKPKPRDKSGSIEYVVQNPNDAAKAVPPHIIEKALDAAIEAKNLDAAVGIIENTYAAKAFARQKLLRRALVPASLAATAPVAIYLAATNLANLQSSFDHRTATAVAAAGMLAYVGFTGSMGLLSVLTHNDQMQRVTWAPGITLRERWLREDSRAAFDKVACSFGFSQSQRYGEEEGHDFQTLRQFLMRKGMILDRVELMKGMW